MEGQLIRKVKDVYFYANEEKDQFDFTQYKVYAYSKKQKGNWTLAVVNNMDEVNECVEYYAKSGFNFFNKFKLEV